MTEETNTADVQIEIEKEEPANEPTTEPTTETSVTPSETITKKKVSELTKDEKNKLITDAKNGIENEFYKVTFCKNGNSRITLKKQTKAQELIKSNESNKEKIDVPKAKYLTDNQLLMEHIINLESLYGQLRQKHKKLKKRYNELEGYLYADDEEVSQTKHERDVVPELQRSEQQIQPERDVVPELHGSEQKTQTQTISNNQTNNVREVHDQRSVQRRYVRSWRDLRPHN